MCCVALWCCLFFAFDIIFHRTTSERGRRSYCAYCLRCVQERSYGDYTCGVGKIDQADCALPLRQSPDGLDPTDVGRTQSSVDYARPSHQSPDGLDPRGYRQAHPAYLPLPPQQQLSGVPSCVARPSHDAPIPPPGAKRPFRGLAAGMAHPLGASIPQPWTQPADRHVAVPVDGQHVDAVLFRHQR